MKEAIAVKTREGAEIERHFKCGQAAYEKKQHGTSKEDLNSLWILLRLAKSVLPTLM